MNPNQNTGSFGAAIGGSDALKEAMARRGMDVSVLQQQSPASAGGGSIAQPSPDVAAAQSALPATPPQPKEPDTDMQIALKALAGVVKTEGEIKKSVVQMRSMGAV